MCKAGGGYCAAPTERRRGAFGSYLSSWIVSMNTVPLATVLGALSTKYETTSLVEM